MRSPLIEAGQVFAAPESPSPRETHPHHDPNEESPGRRVSLAQVWGRAAPNVLPAENTARSIRSRKTRPRLAADSVPPSLRSPSGSPQRNAQARSELTKPDNRTAFENVLTAIPTHGGIENATSRKPSLFS